MESVLCRPTQRCAKTRLFFYFLIFSPSNEMLCIGKFKRSGILCTFDSFFFSRRKVNSRSYMNFPHWIRCCIQIFFTVEKMTVLAYSCFISRVNYYELVRCSECFQFFWFWLISSPWSLILLRKLTNKCSIQVSNYLSRFQFEI